MGLFLHSSETNRLVLQVVLNHIVLHSLDLLTRQVSVPLKEAGYEDILIETAASHLPVHRHVVVLFNDGLLVETLAVLVGS